MDRIEPPPGLTVRPPDQADLEAVVALCRACEEADDGRAETTPDTVLADWSRSGFELSRDAWLMTGADGRIVGYADVWERSPLAFVSDACVSPGFRGRGAGGALVASVEARVRERLADAPPGTSASLTGVVWHGDEGARRLFEQAGYEPMRYFWRFEIAMAEEPAPPQWPQGVAVRTFVPGQDGRAVYTLVQEAFGDNFAYTPITYEDWAHFMTEREGFDPSLYFLAMDERGIAGVSLAQWKEQEGWVHQFAIRRDWRRRGLGRALLRHTFGEFYRRGFRRAHLFTDSYNRTGSVPFYQSVGMHIARQYDAYRKEITADA